MSTNVTVPFLVPLAVGVKVTLTMQMPCGATVERQSLVCAKSPVAVMLPIVSAALPALVTVTVWGWLVVPTFWAGKASLDGVKDTAVP